MPAADIPQILTDAQSSDDFRQQNAARRLAGAQPDPQNHPEASRVLETLLGDKSRFMRQAAARGLGIWGKKNNLSALTKTLDDPEFSVRWAAIEALGLLGDGSAPPAVARHLTDAQNRFLASRALQALGALAADAVIPYLKNEDWALRLEICRILKVVGTKDSVSALQEATKDSNGLVAQAARDALQAIGQR